MPRQRDGQGLTSWRRCLCHRSGHRERGETRQRDSNDASEGGAAERKQQEAATARDSLVVTLGRCVGAGSFSVVREGTLRTASGELRRVAVKQESATARVRALEYEYQVYLHMQSSGVVRVPRVYGCRRAVGGGVEMVMDWCHSSLQDLHRLYSAYPALYKRPRGRRLVSLALWTLEALREVHGAGVVHGDVKPANFMVGCAPRHRTAAVAAAGAGAPTPPPPPVLLIDFGMATRYVKGTHSKQHVAYRDGSGTPRFMSLFTHAKVRRSRRDDVMSWIYTLVFLSRGGLPWEVPDPTVPHDIRIARILAAKAKATMAQLTRGLPLPLMYIAQDAERLQFHSAPPYRRWLQQLRAYLDRHGGPVDAQVFHTTPEAATYGSRRQARQWRRSRSRATPSRRRSSSASATLRRALSAAPAKR